MTADPALALPLAFETWAPSVQAVALGVFTLVSEDAATVTGATLAAGDALGWAAAFWGCFLGIWLGDAGLYGLARGLGRPLLGQAWARRFLDPARVEASERWFARKGTGLLVLSRFVPGMRLPTYLAAGLLRVPFNRFLLITGLLAAVWTLGIFLLAQLFGDQLAGWLRHHQAGAWGLPVALVALWLMMRLVVRAFRPPVKLRWQAAFDRWRRWEFWPAWLFYPPVVGYVLWLMVRHRGVSHPTAANPGIFSGGLVGESKLATLRDLTANFPEFTAAAYAVPGGTVEERLVALRDLLARGLFEYPFVLKPDIGQRGVGVKLIRDEAQAAGYFACTSASLVAQRYAPGPAEVGIFYYRHPHESRGRIFAITEKIFPCVTGDGVRTIEELIWADSRARILAAKYLARFGDRGSEVPPDGKTLSLVVAGNHAQGCIFRDGARLWSSELEAQIDLISRGLNGFFIGRYDIRYADEGELRAGRRFTIIELNGAASEATSIYDSRHSLFAAYRTLFKQWDLVFAIGAANRARGASFTGARAMWAVWRAASRTMATYPPAD